MQIRALAISVVMFGVIGCKAESAKSSSATPAAPGSAEAALMQRSRDWAKAAATGNVDSALAYWSDDAIVLQPGQPASYGKVAIRKMVEGSMKIPKFSITWEPEHASISPSGDMGYLVEHNRVTMADSTGKVHTEYGQGVTVWKKDASGVWRCVVDIFTPSLTERVFPEG
jgi:ketosteroid isomerase-like protein